MNNYLPPHINTLSSHYFPLLTLLSFPYIISSLLTLLHLSHMGVELVTKQNKLLTQQKFSLVEESEHRLQRPESLEEKFVTVNETVVMLQRELTLLRMAIGFDTNVSD